jgi:hypothetical protein
MTPVKEFEAVKGVIDRAVLEAMASNEKVFV